MLRSFETTTGDKVWIDDRHVVNVYGEQNNVKITLAGLGGLQSTWVFKGHPADIAQAFNGYYDDD